CSNLQPCCALGVGQRLDASVVEVAAAVENDAVDLGLLGFLREQLADLGRLRGLVALERLDLQPAGRRNGAAVRVVNELRDDAAIGARDDQARALGRAGDLPPDTAMPAQARFANRERRHARLPTFRRTYSPWYRMPLPLYGSGGLTLRTSAAIWPTCCLFTPLTTTSVCVGTSKLMPCGALITTGWE